MQTLLKYAGMRNFKYLCLVVKEQHVSTNVSFQEVLRTLQAESPVGRIKRSGAGPGPENF